MQRRAEARERPARTVEIDGGEIAFRAVEAWRAPGGPALCYFVRLESGEPGAGDREDRRAALDPGRTLTDLDRAELRDLLDGAAPLTATERRFRAPDGRFWLAQSVGPVWAEESAAEAVTGVRFTSLEGELERLEGPGGHVGRASEEELREAWRRAAGDDRSDVGSAD